MSAIPAKHRNASVIDLPVEEQPEVGGYKVAAQVSVEELLAKDADDASLQRYKASLIDAKAQCKFPDDPRKVIVESISIICPDRPPIVLDPTDTKLKEKPYTLKEGTPFTVKLKFYVQKDVVLGLKYMYFVYRSVVTVEKDTQMVGSYGPNMNAYEWSATPDEAPSGLLARGHYTAKARIMDDDGNIHCELEYAFDIKKDW